MFCGIIRWKVSFVDDEFCVMVNNDCKGKFWKLLLEYGEVFKYEFFERG